MDERKIAGRLCFINQGSGADTMTYYDILQQSRKLGQNP